MLASTELVVRSYSKIINLAHALSNRLHLGGSKSYIQIVCFDMQNCAPMRVVHFTHEGDNVLLSHPNIYRHLILDMKFVKLPGVTG